MTDRNCDTCELCMPVKGNFVCAGGVVLQDGRNTYGMPIEETKKIFPNGCDDYSESHLHHI